MTYAHALNPLWFAFGLVAGSVAVLHLLRVARVAS
jgi:hypothetical protein